jgi:hypothetical protein
MTLIRVLHAEALKMKRTIALKMVVLLPAIVVLLILFLAYAAPFTFVQRRGIHNEWEELTSAVLRLWAMLTLPLYITLETALIAGLDHSENQWKSLLARPVPRWTLYVAKLLVVAAMVVASTVVLVAGILIVGAILPKIQPQVIFGFPIPWAVMLRDSSLITGLAFLTLAIQHWVSLRWRSFSVAVGFGIVAMVTGFLLAAIGRSMDSWPEYLPWALPMLVLTRQPHDFTAILLISGAAGLIVAAAGCWDFCRREVT